MIWANAVSFVNARVVTPGVDTPVAGSIRFSSRVLSIGGRPKPHDTIVDLRGAIVLPGLINAHDHLELNHYGRLKGRDRYENASAWIDDMRPRLTADPAIRRDRAQPLVERLFIGSLKNLLAGVTTVAHHNPFYPEMRRTMAVRVVRRYGWAQSFLLERCRPGARRAWRRRGAPVARDAPDAVRPQLARARRRGARRTAAARGAGVPEAEHRHRARGGD
jgi:hypothetical protein